MALDQQLFLLINHFFPNPLLARVMLFLSVIGRVGGVWLVLGLMAAIKAKKKDLKSVVFFLYPLILALALSHALVNIALKPLVVRMRPGFALPEALVLGPFLDDFSFPSFHATSSFAAAFVLAGIKSKWQWLFYFLAVLISFSRIYIGVHYPLDVLVGAVLGVVIGRVAIFINKKI